MKIDTCFSRHLLTKAAISEKQNFGNAFFSLVSPHPTTPSLASSVMVHMTQSLLKIQEIPDSLEKKREAKKRGEALLGLLGMLQTQFLGGDFLPFLLEIFENTKDLGTSQIKDPYLRDILEQIELRAAIALTQLKKQIPFS
ncbi:MAG: flagellar assembly protein FliX [Alphaproteobacteria bacterium]